MGRSLCVVMSSYLLLVGFCLVTRCEALRTLQAAGATTTLVSIKASQLLSKPDCCWQCVKVPGCVDATDQGRALSMLKENEWAAASRKKICSTIKCSEVVYKTFPVTSSAKPEIIPAFVSIVLADTPAKVVISARKSVYKKHAALTFSKADITVNRYQSVFEADNWFFVKASTFTLADSTLKGQLRLFSIQASAVAFRGSRVAMVNTHVAIGQASSVLLEGTFALFSWSKPQPSRVGPHQLGSSNPFMAVDSTITVRQAKLQLENVSDAFFLRTRIVLDGSQLVLINSNVRMIDCSLEATTSVIELRNSRLQLSHTKATADRFVAQATGYLSVTTPKVPFKDVSGLPLYASGTGKIVLKSIPK